MNEKEENKKFGNGQFSFDSPWLTLINVVEKVKPSYGTITLELVFHQNALARANIHDKTQSLVFKKDIKND
jgi:hypothetical protein